MAEAASFSSDVDSTAQGSIENGKNIAPQASCGEAASDFPQTPDY
jgi:hypothetical protein